MSRARCVPDRAGTTGNQGYSRASPKRRLPADRQVYRPFVMGLDQDRAGALCVLLIGGSEF